MWERKHSKTQNFSQLISSASKVKDGLMRRAAESIVYPYRSTIRDRSDEVMEAMGMIRGADMMRSMEAPT